jgi:predicted nucleotidyltransferase
VWFVITLSSLIALVDLDIILAFIFGAVARDEITESSDIDLFIIGDTSMRDVTRALKGVPDQLGREINPVVE